MQTWEAQEAQWQQEWEQRYGPMGIHWDEVRAAHRFGWYAAQRPEFQGKTWAEVSADLRRHWSLLTEASEETAWDYVQEAVRDGWRRAREALGQPV